MKDRDKEIEALAIMCAAEDTMRNGIRWDHALVKARMILDARDAWRSTRNQPPAPDIHSHKRFKHHCCFVGCDKAADFAICESTDPDPYNGTEACAQHLGELMGSTRAPMLDASQQIYTVWCIADTAPAPEAAEPTPPALPTDRMGRLELWLRCCHALGLDGAVDRVDADDTHFLLGIKSPSEPCLKRNEFDRLQALAAELTAKDGRDG